MPSPRATRAPRRRAGVRGSTSGRLRPTRLVCILVIVLTAGVACDEDERRAVGHGCAICALIGQAGVEAVGATQERDALLASCGECPSGQVCNLVLDPPACTPEPGVEGTACGLVDLPVPLYVCEGSQCHSVDRLNFTCAAGLTCAHPQDGGPGRCEVLPAPD